MIRRFTGCCSAIITTTIIITVYLIIIIIAACLATSLKWSFPGSIGPIIAVVRGQFRTYFIAIISMNIQSKIVRIDKMKLYYLSI